MFNFYKYSALICTILLSCTSHDEILQENEQLQSEITELKDSIKNLKEGSDLNYWIEVLQADTSKGYLGNLHADTLVLKAHFSQCGEFGGNREWIRIFKESDVTKCLIICDSADCENYNYETRYTRIDSSIYVLDRNKELRVINYLNELTKLVFTEQRAMTNALNSYSAEIKSMQTTNFLKSFKVSAIDWSTMWTEFIELRNELKN